MHTIEVRMTCGCDCGSIISRPAVVPTSPLQVIPEDNIVAGWDSAVRVFNGGTGAVSALPDVSGNGFNLEQTIVASQPILQLGGGPNGNDSILFDGIDDHLLNGAIDRPAPSISNTFFWAVIRQVTYTTGDRFWSQQGNNRLAVMQEGVTPDIVQANVTHVNSNGGLPINTYRRLEVAFTNSVSDYIKAGAIIAAGANAGDIDPTAGFMLGADNALASFSNIEVCELWLFNVVPTITQRAALDAYVLSRYGAGLT